MDRSSDETTVGFVARTRQMLALVPSPPRAWLIATLIAALLSTLEVKLEGGVTSLTFRVTAITAVLIALIWLPVIVSVYALVGGSVKTPVGETSSPGLLEVAKLLPEDARRPALASFAAAAEVAANTATGPERERALIVGHEVEKELITLPPPASVERRLNELSEQYEYFRRTLPSGGERNLKLSALTREARSLVSQGVVKDEVIRHWVKDFARTSDGKRVIGLALIRALRHPQTSLEVFYEVALDGIANPRSPFEQYQALRIMENMVTYRVLGGEQRRRLTDALKHQRGGGTGAIITPDDPSRWDLSGNLLRTLGSVSP
jgi:hypothetical protein